MKPATRNTVNTLGMYGHHVGGSERLNDAELFLEDVCNKTILIYIQSHCNMTSAMVYIILLYDDKH